MKKTIKNKKDRKVLFEFKIESTMNTKRALEDFLQDNQELIINFIGSEFDKQFNSKEKNEISQLYI